MKRILSGIAALAILMSSFAFALPARAATPNWDVNGTYTLLVAGTYAHDMELVMSPDGTFAGLGGYPAGSPPYSGSSQTGELYTGGIVSGNDISFTLTYTGPYAIGSTWNLVGTIAPDGSMSGTVPFEWHTTAGAALNGTLAAEDFGVVNYDTGLGTLKGYTAGFSVSGATLAGATSVIVNLYSGVTLLQTDTAVLPKFNTDITGTQFSAPFNVSGTFNYAADGYWTNVRASEYGQHVPATKVVATVTLSNGKTVTATNMALTGDPASIYPAPLVTPASRSDCKNNGWKAFTSPTFKNQGQCVSYTNHN